MLCIRLVLGFLNVLALAFSIFQIIFAIVDSHASTNHNYKDCNRNSAWMILWLSVFLFLMSSIGLIASCLKSRVLQLIYMVVAVTATLVAVAITVFTFAALPNSSANATLQKASHTNWLHEFSPLLRRAVVNDKDWLAIRKCLLDVQLCQRYNNRRFDDLHLETDQNFLQLGCCVPPNRCGFNQKNGTNWEWEIPKPGPAASDEECKKWANRRDGECYDCDSCKAGYLAKFQADWRADGGIFIGIVVTLVIVTILSCYILRKETTKHLSEEKDDESISLRSTQSQNKHYSVGEFSIPEGRPRVIQIGGGAS